MGFTPTEDQTRNIREVGDRKIGDRKIETADCVGSNGKGETRFHTKSLRIHAAVNHCEIVIDFSVNHFSVAGFTEFRILSWVAGKARAGFARGQTGNFRQRHGECRPRLSVVSCVCESGEPSDLLRPTFP